MQASHTTANILPASALACSLAFILAVIVLH